MRVLITGGTGFVGQALCPALRAAGHESVILTRQSRPRLPPGATSAASRLVDLDAGSFDAVVNLAGAPVDGARWTERRVKELFDSRVGTTAALVEWLRAARRRPGVLVSASAVGYYGEQGDRPITEDTQPTPGLTHDLCAAWEAEAQKADALGVRVCVMRIGVVLDRGGGALAKMLPAFQFGLGGRLGAGRHYFPWIHRDDVVGACRWLIDSSQARGAYNLGAPNPVTNAEFTRELARALRRPAVLPMPEAALKLLFGDMAQLLLASDRMLPRRLLDEGFRFRYPTLDPALAAIFGRD